MPERAEENETFRKIRDYCLKNKYYETYSHFLTEILEPEDLKNNPEYKSVIYSSLGTPSDYDLSDEEWEEVSQSLHEH